MKLSHLAVVLLFGSSAVACRNAAPQADPSPSASRATPSSRSSRPVVVGRGPEGEDLCANLPCRPETPVSVRTDKGMYEVKFPPLPYAYKDLVRVLPKDNFVLTADVEGDKLVRLRYVKSPPAKPENMLRIQFDGGMLTIDNHFKKVLRYRAEMQPAGQDEFRKTSTCPVQPGLAAFETWGGGLVSVLLRDFRLVEPGSPEARGCK